MNTKKAIEWVSNGCPSHSEKETQKTLAVLDLLKRGEKYEAMWGELAWPNRGYAKFSLHLIREMKDIKQKYFPKIIYKTNERETLIDVARIYKDLTDFHEKLLKKYFPKEVDTNETKVD